MENGKKKGPHMHDRDGRISVKTGKLPRMRSITLGR